ncbi:MAG: hypothetical protein DRO12_01070 [Thermoprotei archaeon]|nr:MAG: hypothetical protein DRO12_01070 [Thermoprotei archaeon]
MKPVSETQFLVVKLNAKMTVIKESEHEEEKNTFLIKTRHAIPYNVYRDLNRWRARNWKRLMKLKVLDWMNVPLFSSKDLPKIKKILDQAVKEYEEIISRIPDEEIRSKFYCKPQILVVSPPPGIYEENFRQDISTELLTQLQQTVQQILEKHEEKDPELKKKLDHVESLVDELIKKLQEVQEKSIDVEKLVQALQVNESLKQLVTQLTALRVASRIDLRVVKAVESDLKKIEKVQEILTPEAKKLLEVAKQHLEAIKRGQTGDLSSAVEELEKALSG